MKAPSRSNSTVLMPASIQSSQSAGLTTRKGQLILPSVSDYKCDCLSKNQPNNLLPQLITPVTQLAKELAGLLF